MSYMCHSSTQAFIFKEARIRDYHIWAERTVEKIVKCPNIPMICNICLCVFPYFKHNAHTHIHSTIYDRCLENIVRLRLFECVCVFEDWADLFLLFFFTFSFLFLLFDRWVFYELGSVKHIKSTPWRRNDDKITVYLR